MNTQKPKSDVDKLNEIVKTLPSFTSNFFYGGMTNKSILTAIAYAHDLKYFFDYAVNYYPYFPEKKVNELTLDDISKITAVDFNVFTKWMKDSPKLSERTRARRRASVSVLYDYLIKVERKLTYSPVVKESAIKIDLPEEVTYLHMEEQEILLDCIYHGTGLSKKQLGYHNSNKIRDLAIVFLFLDTGLRLSELASLNTGDIVIFEHPSDKTHNYNYVNVLRKGRKQDSSNTSRVYFSDESKEYIRDYLDERIKRGEDLKDNAPLFITLDGNRLSTRAIQDMVKKYVKASLHRSDISVHKLRSSFAMEFYKHNKNILVLQQRMGHKSITATNIYTRASDKEKAVIESSNWRNS